MAKQCKKLHELFNNAVTLYPQNVAVEYYRDSSGSKQYLTYEEVLQHAIQVEQLIRFHMQETSACSNITVALYLDADVFLPSLVLGILNADCNFMPISPHSPFAVNSKLFKVADIRFIVTNRSYQAQLENSQFCVVSKVCTFTLKAFPSEEHSLIILVVNGPKVESKNHITNTTDYGDLAYVLSTSGTTGDPKLVLVPHKCILPNVIHLLAIYEATSDDKIAMCSPITFDPSVVEMFIALGVGATVVIASDAVKCDPSSLSKVLFTLARVTVMQATPTLYSRFSPSILKDVVFSDTSSLRVAVFGGETCPSYQTLKRWVDCDLIGSRSKSMRFINLYGITEVSSWSTYFEIDWNDIIAGKMDPISLGWPLLETVVEIVTGSDEALCRIVSGLRKEDFTFPSCFYANICVNSSVKVQVFNEAKWQIHEDKASVTGYIKVGGSERQCYVKVTEDAGCCGNRAMRNTGDLVTVEIGLDAFMDLVGCLNTGYANTSCYLYYVGRTDGQIKRNGKRMNVLAVKQQLEDHELLSAAHVVNINLEKEKFKEHFDTTLKTFQREILIAFVVLGKDQMSQSTKNSLFDYLHCTLDSHCIPDEIVFIDKLPVTSHGKVDEMTLLTQWQANPLTSDTSPIRFDNRALKNVLFKSWCMVLDGKCAQHSFANNSFSDHLNCNFITCGGDSFRAVKLVSMLQKQLNGDDSVIDEAKLLDGILRKTLGDVLNILTDFTQAFKTDGNFPAIKNRGKKRPSLSPSFPRSSKSLKKVITDVPVSCARRGNQLFDLTEGVVPRINIFTSLKKFQSEKIFLRQAWNFDTKKCIDASPLVVLTTKKGDQGFAVIGSHSHLLACLDLASGATLWQVELSGRIESSASLTLCGDFVAVGCYDHHVYFVSASDGAVTWKFKTGDQVKSSPCPGALNSSCVYIGSHDGYLYCLNAQLRALQWKYYSGAPIFSSPIYSEDLCESSPPGSVFACSLSGKIFLLSAIDGAIRWTSKLPKPVFSSAASSSVGLCVGCVDNCLYTLDRKTGNLIWKFESGGPIFSSPAVYLVMDQELVVCGSHDGYLNCLDSASGSLKWKFPQNGDATQPAVYATPFCTTLTSNKEVYSVAASATTDGNLSIIDLISGRLLTQHKLPGHVFSSPIVVGQENNYLLLVGCRNDCLYCFKIDFLNK